jgi:two-component system, OmpR family, phosphate regulon sensor histidine kinase PhoR
MRKKILTSYFIIIGIMAIAFVSVANYSVRDSIQNQITRHFLAEIHVISDTLERLNLPFDELQSYLNSLNLPIEQRLTFIDQEGLVLADNYENPDYMDNHLGRPEIQMLKENVVYGTSIRYSDTIKQDALYVARVVTINDQVLYIRLSKPFIHLREFNKTILQYTLLGTVISAFIVVLMGLYVSKKLTDPIESLTKDVNSLNESNMNQIIFTQHSDEIGQLSFAFNKMRKNLVEAMGDLESRNAELKAILNSMVSGVIAVDQKREIILINQKSREILNLTESNIGLQDSMYKVIRNEDIVMMINSSIDRGEQQMRELLHVHLDKVLRVIIHPILTEDQTILGSMIVLEDITQIKRLENMRSEFVSNVSHELKTPLTSIVGFVDTLKHGALEDPIKSMRFLTIIETEAERLNRLITDILLLSEIENGTREPEATLVEVGAVINEVIDMLHLRVKDKPVELEVIMDEPVLSYMSKDRIKQLLINLVDNAIKYTEIGYVKVYLKRQGDNMLIRVEDTGIGISDAHKLRLFERFYRVDKARSRKVGGTGLGLSIVKHIVNLYKGDIQLESKVGEGSAFSVRLPIIKKDR